MGQCGSLFALAARVTVKFVMADEGNELRMDWSKRIRFYSGIRSLGLYMCWWIRTNLWSRNILCKMRIACTHNTTGIFNFVKIIIIKTFYCDIFVHHKGNLLRQPPQVETHFRNLFDANFIKFTRALPADLFCVTGTIHTTEKSLICQQRLQLWQ